MVASTKICALVLLSTVFLLLMENAKGVSTVRGIVYSSMNVTNNNQTVVLGALVPIHRVGSGRSDPCGSIRGTAIQIVESMVFATEMINNDSSLLPNISLAFDIRDTCTSVNYALQQSVGYITSVSDSACNADGTLGISGVIGSALSSISQATANLFGLFQIPQVSYGATSPTLSESQFRYFFRTIPSDEFQARALAGVIVHFQWKYIILLHSDDLYGTDGATAFRRELEATNSTACIATQISLTNNPPNHDEAVDDMGRAWISNASVVVLFGHSEDAAAIFRTIQRRQQSDDNYLSNITWIGSDSWGTTVPRRFRTMAKGMLGLFPRTSVIPAFTHFFSSLTPTNNLRNPWFVEFWEFQFRCNLGLSPQLPNCSLNNQSLRIPQYVQVPLMIDAVYALAHSIQALITTHCPDMTLCPAITVDCGAVNGTMLREQLLNVTFESLIEGKVEFDQNGDVSQASYSIFNLQESENGNLRFQNIGSWSKDQLNIVKDVEWTTGTAAVPVSECGTPCEPSEVRRLVPDRTSCCFTCEACQGNTISMNDECRACNLGDRPSPNRTVCEPIPLSFLTWSDPWAIFIVALACIGLIVTIVVIAIFITFHKHEIIRATSRELSAILLVGIFLCFTVPFLYIATPSRAVCGIQRFSIGFCFAISFSALLVKTIRIHRIFNRSSSTMSKPLKFVNPLSQMLFTLGLIGIQVLISVVWLIAEPPQAITVPSMSSRELVCGANPFIGVSVFLGYNFILLILSTYYAFRTRKVPANFNEARFINITLYTICIIWLAFVPIHFSTTSLGVLFRTVTLVMGVIFSAGTTLGCLFISKIFILFTRVKKDKKLESMNKSDSKIQSNSKKMVM